VLNIALVTHDLAQGGGVATMTAALYAAIQSWDDARARIVSLAVSATDDLSVRLSAPHSWSSGVRTAERVWRGIPYLHVGTVWPEIERCRYSGHAEIRRQLMDCDVIQFVSGTAAWAHVAAGLDRPVAIWAGATVLGDRTVRVATARGLRKQLYRVGTGTLHRLERQALNNGTLVCALGEHLANELRRIAPEATIESVPIGVDVSLFRPVTPSSDGGYIISVGRFSDPRKNVMLLLRAYAEAVTRDPRVCDLWLVGERPTPSAVNLCHQLGISGRVHMLGVRQGEELARLYRDAQFFVMSSDDEGLGIVVLEAMASGLPVITTACGGPEPIVRSGIDGYVVPVGDLGSLAQAILTLTERPDLRRRFGLAGRDRAVASYSWTDFATAFALRYRRLVNCG
jgi:glycosyltransferase involved in cell wall biosynthesis